MREKSFQSYSIFKIVSALKLVLTFETQCIFNSFKIAKFMKRLTFNEISNTINIILCSIYVGY